MIAPTVPAPPRTLPPVRVAPWPTALPVAAQDHRGGRGLAHGIARPLVHAAGVLGFLVDKGRPGLRLLAVVLGLADGLALGGLLIRGANHHAMDSIGARANIAVVGAAGGENQDKGRSARAAAKAASATTARAGGLFLGGDRRERSG
ncbi:MAG: hypothetical protein NDJ90_15325 [Oligoflexia bacterium]|nr:hypothetical protein [Oligoflexia bacterium]